MPRPSWKRRLVLGALVFGATCAALGISEGVLRLLLFTEADWTRTVADRLRRPALYSHQGGEEYWKLQARLGGAQSRQPHPHLDERFGWLKPEIDATTLRHVDESKLGGRRPVLLYGDSYAACFVGREDCWEGQLERSALGTQYALLNYGVLGFGLDQIYLLMRETLDLYADLSPVVVVGILVDDDLDRCGMGLRGYPKPHFLPVGGELVLVPFTEDSPWDYVNEHPIGIRSYLWRIAVLHSGIVGPRRALQWIGEDEQVKQVTQVSKMLLSAIENEVSRRDLELFFLLFHGRRSARLNGPFLWQEPLLYAELERLQAPFVSSKRWLRREAERSGRDVAGAYVPSGEGINHFTVESHAVVFEALAEGLEGRFEPHEYLAEPADDR